jgi:hypothetical protein
VIAGESARPTVAQEDLDTSSSPLSPNPAPAFGLTPPERAWLFTATLAVFLLTLIPPSLARTFGPEDRVHIGTYWYTADFSVYLAAMREAMTSQSWLVHNHTTAEPHAPALIFPLYVAIGKLAFITGLPTLALYAAVEAAGRVMLSVTVYLFAAHFLASAGQRRLAWVLGVLAGGIGIWVGLAQRALGVAVEEVKGINPFVETATFGALWAAPHIALGLSATLLAIVLASLALQGSRGALIALAVDVAVLGFVHPFNLPVLLVAFGISALVWIARTPAPSPAARLRAAVWPITVVIVAGIAASPIVLYSARTFALDPFWSAAYGAQNAMLSPPPWELPLDYGVVLLLAPVGILALRRHALSPSQTLLLIWIATTLPFMYAPVPYQRRFAVGLFAALAVLSALAWPLVQQSALALADRLGAGPRQRRHVARRLTVYPLMIFGFTSTLFVFLGITASAMTNSPVPIYFVDRDTYQLGQWLADRTGPDDVVAAAYETGNVLSGMLPGRVVVGNVGITPHGKEKYYRLEAMFRGDLSGEETRAFLRANRVTYLVVGPEERKLGPNDPGVQLGLPIALRIGNAIAYRLDP